MALGHCGPVKSKIESGFVGVRSSYMTTMALHSVAHLIVFITFAAAYPSVPVLQGKYFLSLLSQLFIKPVCSPTSRSSC